jgi:hypothetical protein
MTKNQQPMTVQTDLPDDLYMAIGMVVVQFSYLEWILSRIVYDLKNLETPVGRQESLPKQVKGRLELLFQLARDLGLVVTIDQAELLSRASEYEGKRDLLSHAIFVRDRDGVLMVRDAKKGKKWQPPGQRGRAVDQSVEPMGQKIDADVVAGLAENIAWINRALDALWSEIAPQLSNSRHGKI